MRIQSCPIFTRMTTNHSSSTRLIGTHQTNKSMVIKVKLRTYQNKKMRFCYMLYKQNLCEQFPHKKMIGFLLSFHYKTKTPTIVAHSIKSTNITSFWMRFLLKEKICLYTISIYIISIQFTLISCNLKILHCHNTITI